MTTLKVKVSSKEKTTKELEDKIDDMRKLHWDKEKQAESARRELERRSFEKYEEAERLRLKLVETEQRAQEPDRLRRAHEDLERVYASLQHQYQVTQHRQHCSRGAQHLLTLLISCIFFAQNSSKNGECRKVKLALQNLEFSKNVEEKGESARVPADIVGHPVLCPSQAGPGTVLAVMVASLDSNGFHLQPI